MQVFPFIPNPIAPFRFQPTLDGNLCTGTVEWNLAGQRWYLHMRDVLGNDLFYVPMISSPDGIPTINLTWDGARQLVVITANHKQRIGQLVVLTLTNVVPTAYNGIWLMYAETSETLTYPQTVSPGGDATTQGLLSHNINLAGGYTTDTTVVYRGSSGNIEIDTGITP
jgi:hypothetical protein